MPELPEVETIRRDLQRVVLHKKISHVEVRKRKMIVGDASAFIRTLSGRSINAIERRGKLLIFTLSASKRAPARYVLIHLKMTGQLIYVNDYHRIVGGHSWPPAVGVLPNKYSHIIFTFNDGARLYFNDMRQFGYARLVSAQQKKEIVDRFGLEPLLAQFTPAKLKELLKRRTAPLKNVLLDQTAISGLGNIYVDEACFRAGIRPMRPANRVTSAEVRQLHRAIQTVLRLAIKYRGTTFNDYRDGQGKPGSFVRHLNAYGRRGALCRRRGCRQQGSVIQKTVVAGRGTHYCPTCQH